MFPRRRRGRAPRFPGWTSTPAPLQVYKFLFREGVCYAEKDMNLPKHPEIDVPNLHVIKLMQSFKSKGFVSERFAWRHYYW